MRRETLSYLSFKGIGVGKGTRKGSERKKKTQFDVGQRAVTVAKGLSGDSTPTKEGRAVSNDPDL